MTSNAGLNAQIQRLQDRINEAEDQGESTQGMKNELNGLQGQLQSQLSQSVTPPPTPPDPTDQANIHNPKK